MAFTFRMMIDAAGTPMALELPQTNAANTKGTIAVDTSGYVGAAGADPDLHTLIGVIDETQDNSGGAVGDLNISVVISRNILWEAVTKATPTQAQMHDVVSLDASSVVDEDDPITANTETGVVKLVKLIDAANKKVLCKLMEGVASNA